MGEDLNRVRMDQLTKEELIQLCANWAAHARELEKLVESPMVAVLRKAQMQESAELIRGELVCCDIFHRMEALVPAWSAKPDERDWSAWKALKASREYHDLCYFGEWSAVIVEKGPRDERDTVREERVGQDDSPGGVPVREGAVHEPVGVGAGEATEVPG